jgi:hypothetical protein
LGAATIVGLDNEPRAFGEFMFDELKRVEKDGASQIPGNRARSFAGMRGAATGAKALAILSLLRMPC